MSFIPLKLSHWAASRSPVFIPKVSLADSWGIPGKADFTSEEVLRSSRTADSSLILEIRGLEDWEGTLKEELFYPTNSLFEYSSTVVKGMIGEDYCPAS